MRILHVAESIKGGCGTYLDQLVRAQMADGAITAVHAVLPDAHIGQTPHIPEALRTVFPSGGRNPASLLALWRATAAAIERWQPDCVHLHSTFAGVIGRVGLNFARSRPAMLYCAHGWAFDMAGSGIKRSAMALAERSLSFGCEGVIAISEYERARGIAIGIAPERIVTVLNGISDTPPIGSAAASAAPARTRRRRLLFIGRLDRQKGIDVLLKAISGLQGRVELRIVGSAVVDDQPAIDAGRPGVSLLGWCDEARIQQELHWADCVVIPSRWEGFGLVALEAMRASRAVIATNVGGLPEVVDAGKTGWLVPADDPDALRTMLLTLSDAQLVSAGEAGRQRFAQHFTIERTAKALTAVYRQAIAMRSSISHAFAQA